MIIEAAQSTRSRKIKLKDIRQFVHRRYDVGKSGSRALNLAIEKALKKGILQRCDRASLFAPSEERVYLNYGIQ